MTFEAVMEAAGRGLQAVSNNADGALPRGHREAIWAAMGPLGDDEAHRRRATLALDSCRHVLGLWERERPRDRTPHDALELADRALAGDEVERSDALEVAGYVWASADNAYTLAGTPGALMVGYCAARTLMTALDDERFDPADVDLTRQDDDFEPQRLDPAFFAASAASGGPPWDPDTDIRTRREFWQWYLSDAVPRAWIAG